MEKIYPEWNGQRAAKLPSPWSSITRRVRLTPTCLLWLKVIVVQWTKRFSFFAPSIKFESKSLWGQAAAENKPENKITKKDHANVFIKFSIVKNLILFD